MKLLLDQNLSPRLISLVADLFPGSAHVDALGLGSSPDAVVWQHARDNGFILVSKDADFSEMSLGNCTTKQIENALRLHFEAIEQMEQDESVGVLSLV